MVKSAAHFLFTGRIRLFILLAMVMVTHGCIMHAPYERPCVDVPDSWRLEENEGSTLCNFSWWKQFHDPALDSLILEALANNNDLKVAIARVWDFLAQYEIVRSGLYPQISGTASATREELSLITSPPPLGVPRTNTLYQVLGNFSYILDIWGQTVSATEAALDLLIAQEETRRTVVLTLVSEVASAYMTLRQYDMQLKVSQDTLLSRLESYELADLRWKGGLTSEIEVKQAAAEVDSARIEVKQLEISQQQQENLVSILVGRNPGPIERGLALDAMTMPPRIPTGLPSDILDQRPDILAAEGRLAAANANIGAARAQFFPQITLTGDYGNSSFALHNLFTDPAKTWQYGVTLMQPFFTGGRLTAQVDQAEAQILETLYAYFSTIQRAFLEVDNALIFHKKALELVEVQADQVKVLQDYLHLANLQYNNGQTDYLNVLDAERTLFTAQLNYAEALSNSYLSVIDIYKALGGGWVIEADVLALETAGEHMDTRPCCP